MKGNFIISFHLIQIALCEDKEFSKIINFKLFPSYCFLYFKLKIKFDHSIKGFTIFESHNIYYLKLVLNSKLSFPVKQSLLTLFQKL